VAVVGYAARPMLSPDVAGTTNAFASYFRLIAWSGVPACLPIAYDGADVRLSGSYRQNGRACAGRGACETYGIVGRACSCEHPIALQRTTRIVASSTAR
jgi:hypothetical protein